MTKDDDLEPLDLVSVGALAGRLVERLNDQKKPDEDRRGDNGLKCEANSEAACEPAMIVIHDLHPQMSSEHSQERARHAEHDIQRDLVRPIPGFQITHDQSPNTGRVHAMSCELRQTVNGLPLESELSADSVTHITVIPPIAHNRTLIIAPLPAISFPRQSALPHAANDRAVAKRAKVN